MARVQRLGDLAVNVRELRAQIADLAASEAVSGEFRDDWLRIAARWRSDEVMRVQLPYVPRQLHAALGFSGEVDPKVVWSYFVEVDGAGRVRVVSGPAGPIGGEWVDT